jgi:predicted transcriptional regulator
MTTLKVGIVSLDQYKARTMAIVRGEHKVRPDEPKVWFSSIESFAKILSEANRDLLRVIAETEPQSLNELAETTGRAMSNLSRTLKTMERHGLVRFEKGKGRTLVPRTPYTDVVLDLPLRERPKTIPRAFGYTSGVDAGNVGQLAEPAAESYEAGPPSTPGDRPAARRDTARRQRRSRP